LKILPGEQVIEEMKIIICGPAYPYRGGIAAYSDRLAREFIDSGDDTVIYTFTLQYPSFLFPGRTQYSDSQPPQGIKILRVLSSVNPFSWIATGRKIRRMSPDILILRYWLPFMAPALGTVARIARRNRHTKVISIFDNVVPHEKRPGDILLTKFFVRSIDRALVMTKSVADDLKRFSPAMPVVINPHPLYDNYGEPVDRKEALIHLGLDPTKPYMLFFGFIRRYKGLDLLLEAMNRPEIKMLDINLIVAGEFYNEPEYYNNLIEKFSLSERVILHTHFISDSEVKYYFSAASLIVQPYRSATQSGVTQVGYHFNKPMLVTDVGGLAEIVPDGKCGYVVSPDPEAIANAIIDFCANKKEHSFDDGIAKQKQLYSWSRLRKSLLEL
jgi:D-inositol-3-phosphate glycosyltransferase